MASNTVELGLRRGRVALPGSRIDVRAASGVGGGLFACPGVTGDDVAHASFNTKFVSRLKVQ